MQRPELQRDVVGYTDENRHLADGRSPGRLVPDVDGSRGTRRPGLDDLPERGTLGRCECGTVRHDRDRRRGQRPGCRERDAVEIEVTWNLRGSGRGTDRRPGRRGGELHGERQGSGLQRCMATTGRRRRARWGRGGTAGRAGPGDGNRRRSGLYEPSGRTSFSHLDFEARREEPAAYPGIAHRGNGFDAPFHFGGVDQVQRFALSLRNEGGHLRPVDQRGARDDVAAIPDPEGSRPGTRQGPRGGQAVKDGQKPQGWPTASPRPRTSGRSRTPCFS